MKKILLSVLTVCLVTMAAQAQPAKPVSFSIGAFYEWNPATDALAKWVETQCNMHWKVQTTDWDQTVQIQNYMLWAAGGNLPNVITAPLIENNVGIFWKWVDDGVIREIPDAIINKYPNVKETFEASAFSRGIKKLKGKHYGMPVLNGENKMFQADTQSIYYRKDWMKKVGIAAEPKTTAELYELLKRYTYNDPDGNGKNDTYGLTVAAYPTMMHCYWGIDPEAWIQENGKWIPGRISKKNIEALKFFQRLYKEKIFDPEFFNNNVNIVLQKFASNKVGALYRTADAYWVMRVVQRSYLAANAGVTVEEAVKKVGLIPYLVSVKGATPFVPPNEVGTMVMFNGKTTDEQIDRYFYFVEWTKRPEVRNTLRYGFVGKDCDLVNGFYVPRNDEDGNPLNTRDLYPGGGQCMQDSDADIHMTDPRWDEGVRELGLNNMKAKLPYIAEENYIPRMLDLDSIAKYPGVLNTDEINSSYTKIIISADPVEKTFQTWVDNLMKKGMKKIIDDVNAKMATMK